MKPDRNDFSHQTPQAVNELELTQYRFNKEHDVPNISVEIFRGRTLDQRRQFVSGITQSAVDAFGISPEGVRITFFEIDREDLARGGKLFSDLDAAVAAPAENNGASR